MEDEKLPLPKGTVSSILNSQSDFSKLYASMNAEQIARMIQPLG